jgi:hypothetical protein
MEMLNCVKLYHWRTYSYAQHIATDSLYEKLNGHVDQFVEVLLGKLKTRVSNIKIHCPEIPTKQKFIQIIQKYITFLDSMDKTFATDSDLLNIRDEIKADLNQLMYLFTLH